MRVFLSALLKIAATPAEGGGARHVVKKRNILYVSYIQVLPWWRNVYNAGLQ
jgi:hypothetical protein